jgi:hypothetical protein
LRRKRREILSKEDSGPNGCHRDIGQLERLTQSYHPLVNQSETRCCDTITHAIEHHLATLALSQNFGVEVMFSIISIWFDSSFAKYKKYVDKIPNINQVIKDGLARIDRTTFLSLFYQ